MAGNLGWAAKAAASLDEAEERHSSLVQWPGGLREEVAARAKPWGQLRAHDACGRCHHGGEGEGEHAPQRARPCCGGRTPAARTHES